MVRLGFSIYPEHSTPEQDVEYIRMAGRYGWPFARGIATKN